MNTKKLVMLLAVVAIGVGAYMMVGNDKEAELTACSCEESAAKFANDMEKADDAKKAELQKEADDMKKKCDEAAEKAGDGWKCEKGATTNSPTTIVEQEIIHVKIPNGWVEMSINDDMEKNMKENLEAVNEEIGEAAKALPLKEAVLFYYRQSAENLETILPEIKCIEVPVEFHPDVMDQTISMVQEMGARVIQQPLTDDIEGRRMISIAIELPNVYRAFNHYIIEDGYYYILSFIDVPDYNSDAIFEEALKSVSFNKK
tara:strand:+ start:93 stop:869 length:777 start_codon:yes stop_codon:yes gene_type:complete